MSRSIEIASELYGEDITKLREVPETYPLLVSKFITQRIEEGTYSKDAAKQYLPDTRELIDSFGLTDPCNEEENKRTKSLIHKYPNRVALIVTEKCLSYCRFCFRKDFVGFSENLISQKDLDESLTYIRENSEIKDVLVSGGDPLALSNAKILPILYQLAAIEHVMTIRIHTRALALTPMRINPEFLDFLKRNDKFWFYSHFNHPDDLDHPEVLEAVRKLQMTGTPVLNQCVILKGVNDDPGVLKRLLSKCYESRITPYHVYSFDNVKGANHFEPSEESVLNIFRELAGLPGPAQPVFVVVDRDNKKRRFVYDSEATANELKQCLREKSSWVRALK